MPIRLLLFISILVVNSSFVFADERAKEIAQAMTQVQEKKAVAQTWEGRNSDHPYVALLNEYETKINGDWSYEENYHTRVRIQQESAKELGQWPIYYNKTREEITDIKAFVETTDGKKLPAVKVEDVGAFEDAPLYSDMNVKVVTLPDVAIGSVIDVTVKTKVARKEMPDQFWDEIPYPVIPTKFARHTYIFPEDKPIEFKSYKIDRKPLIDKKGGTIKYSFIFEETEYADDEDLMPPKDEVSGTYYLSSVKDWKEVADWYRELSVKNKEDQTEITVKSLELAKDKSTQKEKARAILEFIQDNFRYVAMNFGDHMVEPHSSADIFGKRYGDSKDIALLAKQMFKLVGIDANFALMSGEFTGNPENALPDPAIFEHVTLEAVLDGKKYFVDPQTKGFDFGQFPSTYDNAYVLVIEETGYHFDRLPLASAEERAVISQSDVQVKPDGSALFAVRVKLPLEASQGFRNSWNATDKENREKFFESLESNFAQGGTMLSHEVKGLDQRYGPIEFNLQYESPNAYPLVNDMVLLKEPDQSDVPEFAAQVRKYPIYLPSNSMIQNTNVYHIPDGYKLDSMPQSYKIGIDFVEVATDYQVQEDKVTVNSTYRMKRATVPPQRYSEVRKFRSELYKKNDQYVVLKKKSQTSPQAKEWIKGQ